MHKVVDNSENGERNGSGVQPPLLNGYLKKLGERGIKTFKKRYFRQSGFKVSYYETETDKLDHSKGFINLETIQDVKRSTSHPNAFELVSKESKRTYVLQVCEPNETVEQWMARWMSWVNHVKESWTRAQTAIGSGSARGSVKLTSDLLKLSSFTTVESASGSDVVSSYPEEMWPKVLADTEAETAAQLVAITTMRAAVEELNHEYRNLGQAKETIVERARQLLQEEVRHLDKEIADSQKTLVEADQRLIAKERQVMASERALAASSELVELREALVRALREQIASEQQEIAGQTASLETLRESQRNDPTQSAHSKAAFSATVQADLERLRRHWAANTEQQLLNDQMARQLRTLEATIAAHKESFANSNTKLDKAQEAHQSAVAAIKAELAEAQHVEPSLIGEFEALRQQYFVSLTLCIKLQGEVTGKQPAIDLSDLDALHQRALAECPDHLDWNNWLAELLFPGTPKSQILGRRRASISHPTPLHASVQ
jgi:DNA repair exonuclease SbcCD ATPase subunit